MVRPSSSINVSSECVLPFATHKKNLFMGCCYAAVFFVIRDKTISMMCFVLLILLCGLQEAAFWLPCLLIEVVYPIVIFGFTVGILEFWKFFTGQFANIKQKTYGAMLMWDDTGFGFTYVFSISLPYSSGSGKSFGKTSETSFEVVLEMNLNFIWLVAYDLFFKGFGGTRSENYGYVQ